MPIYSFFIHVLYTSFSRYRKRFSVSYTCSIQNNGPIHCPIFLYINPPTKTVLWRDLSCLKIQPLQTAPFLLFGYAHVVERIFSKVSLFSLAFILFLSLVPFGVSVTFRVLEAPVNYSVSSYRSSLPSFVFKTTVWKNQ